MTTVLRDTAVTDRPEICAEVHDGNSRHPTRASG